MAGIKVGFAHLLLLVAGFYCQLNLCTSIFFGVGPAPPENLEKVKFIYYYGRTVHYNQTYTLHTASQIVTHPKFRLGYKTVMYMHGYSDGANNRSVKSVANAYKLRGNYNIIAVDYADLVAERYFREALPNTIQIAPHITTVVMKWFDKGLNDQLVHLIGHSLGAQLAGIIGREVIQRSNNQRKIRRITGLDPAGPGFFYGSNLQTLESSDATFVVNIHTDAPLFGAPCATGHVDFWPNFATVQPGCPDPENSPGQSPDLCSHTRVWRLFVESVLPDHTPFYAVSTRNWYTFKRGHVDRDDVVVMGEDTPEYARGDYYLQTNGKYPYSRGERGTYYYPVIQS